MIDYIKLRVPILDDVSKFNISRERVIVDEGTGLILKQFGENGGMRIQKHQHCLIIEGSLHKYFHLNNVQDFTFKDIKNAINNLSSTIGFDPCNAQVLKLEVGVNMQADPKLHLMKNYKNRYDFQPMTIPGRRKTYGATASLGGKYRGDLTVKSYDKKLEQLVRASRDESISKELTELLKEGLYRFEIRIENLRWFNSKYPETRITHLTDLIRLDVIKNLSIALLNCYQNIKFKSKKFDCHKLTMKEFACVSLVASEEFSYYRKTDPRASKRQLDLYQSIVDRYEVIDRYPQLLVNQIYKSLFPKSVNG